MRLRPSAKGRAAVGAAVLVLAITGAELGHEGAVDHDFLAGGPVPLAGRKCHFHRKCTNTLPKLCESFSTLS